MTILAADSGREFTLDSPAGPVAVHALADGRVSVDMGMHSCQVDPFSNGKKEIVNLAPADHHDLVGRARNSDRFVRGCDDITAGGLVPGLARDDDVLPAGQRLADLVPGGAADDQVVAHGGLLEVAEIHRQAPRQVAAGADQAHHDSANHQSAADSIPAVAEGGDRHTGVADEGDAVEQIEPGTPFSALPDYWRCPQCDAEPNAFIPVTDES